MEEVQAVELFYRYSQPPHDNQGVQGESKAIIKEFGYLALAVTLAVTYVGRIDAYLGTYSSPNTDGAGTNYSVESQERLINRHNEGLVTAWETYHAINE